MEMIISAVLMSPLIYFAWEGLESKGLSRFNAFCATWVFSVLSLLGYSLLK